MPTFQDVYIVKPGQTLSAIAKSRGYNNPGPIFAFPANHSLFPTVHSADVIRPGQRIYIPWHPDLLRKLIVTSDALTVDATEYATKIIERQIRGKEDLEDYLRKIDAINMIAQITVSMASIVIEGMIEGGELSSRQIAMWLADSRVHMIAGDMVPLIIPTPTAPKKDYKFYLRHTLGPWTPSFWSSVWVAIQEGDVDLYLYGSDALTYRTAMSIKAQADKDVAKLQTTKNDAMKQLAMPYYHKRI